MPTTCAIYTRISSDPTGQRAGVDRQEADCRALAERRGWTVAEVYCDDDTSAYSGRRRDAYERLLADIAAGRVSAVVAWHPDRLYRRVRDLLDLITLAEKHALELATATAGDIDLSTPTGRAVATTIVTWSGTFESEHKAERVRAAAASRASQGRCPRRRSFGYLADHTVVPGEASAIRTAVVMVLAGSSLRSVGRHLDNTGVTTVGGGAWSQDLSGLRTVLTSFKIAAVPNYRGVALPGVAPTWPAIISVSEHEQVRAVLLDDRRRTNGHRSARRSLLSGIATCSVCDGPMRSATKEASKVNKTRTNVYRCHRGNHTTIRAAALDEQVIEAVLVELVTSDLTALAPTEADRDRLAALRSELDSLATRRTDVLALVSEGLSTLAEARPSLEVLRGAQEAAQGALQALSARWGPAAFVARTAALLTDAESDAEADSVAARFASLDLGRQRSIVRSLVSVTVHPGRNARRITVASLSTGARIPHPLESAPVPVIG